MTAPPAPAFCLGPYWLKPRIIVIFGVGTADVVQIASQPDYLDFMAAGEQLFDKVAAHKPATASH